MAQQTALTRDVGIICWMGNPELWSATIVIRLNQKVATLRNKLLMHPDTQSLVGNPYDFTLWSEENTGGQQNISASPKSPWHTCKLRGGSWVEIRFDDENKVAKEATKSKKGK